MWFQSICVSTCTFFFFLFFISICVFFTLLLFFLNVLLSPYFSCVCFCCLVFYCPLSIFIIVLCCFFFSLVLFIFTFHFVILFCSVLVCRSHLFDASIFSWAVCGFDCECKNQISERMQKQNEIVNTWKKKYESPLNGGKYMSHGSLLLSHSQFHRQQLSGGCERAGSYTSNWAMQLWHTNVDTHEMNSNQNRTEFGPTRSKC